MSHQYNTLYSLNVFRFLIFIWVVSEVFYSLGLYTKLCNSEITINTSTNVCVHKQHKQLFLFSQCSPTRKSYTNGYLCLSSQLIAFFFHRNPSSECWISFLSVTFNFSWTHGPTILIVALAYSVAVTPESCRDGVASSHLHYIYHLHVISIQVASLTV